MYKNDFSSSSLYSFFVIKFFLLFSGLTIFFFSLLSLLIPLGLGNLVFPLFFYSLLREFYFVLFGLLWTPVHYYFFFDLNLFNFLLLLFSSLQLLFVYYYSNQRVFSKSFASVFLICNLSFLPFGLIAVIFLSKVQFLDRQPYSGSISDLDQKSRKFALFFIAGLILNYSVAFSILNITRVFFIQSDFPTNNFLLFLMSISLLVAMLVFIAIGFSSFDLKRFYSFSLGSNIIAFITYYFVNFYLSYFYPVIKNQIEYLAPSSIVLVVSCIFFGRIYLYFKSPSREVSSS